MRKIKFIHLSDIHIGLQTHGKINPATGKNTRLEDIVKSLDFVFDYALTESVDLVLIAGDIFHRENPHPTEEIEFARRVVNLVEESRTKVVMVLGNHDYPSAGGKASAVEIFPALDIEGVTIVRKPGLHTLDTENGQVQIACLPWAGRSGLVSKDEYKSLSTQEIQIEIEKRLIAIIRDLASKTDNSNPAIFLGHLSVRNAKLSGTERDTITISDPIVPVSELNNGAFNYVALGHIHRFQNLNKDDFPPIVYSGSIERIDFTEEKEKKGFVIGEIVESEEGWKCEYEFIETPARKFLTIEIDGSDLDSDLNLEKRFKKEDIANAVVRVRFKVLNPGEKIDEKRIKSLFESAQTLKIEKIFEKPEKIMRHPGLSKTMGLMEALDKYIETKPELKDIADEMKSYAEKLIRDNDDQRD
ncbi:MAG: exonuclease SbcCD subunit D [Candidatus Dadabacteria bacterium]|nr:exonuclease SbcCD subunit D [Candidatus Dadabacteria bacterium]MCZ6790894.1 exonuclease SbcCD subunit D [Candidatus Dadabacteria bacterium]